MGWVVRIPIEADVSFLLNNDVRVSVCSILHGLFSVEIIYPNNRRNSYYAANCEIANRDVCATLLCTDFRGSQMEITLHPSLFTRFFSDNTIIPMEIDPR